MKDARREIRRLQLLRLLNDRFGGRQVDLANFVGILPNLVSRYVRGAKGIGEDMRDKIESACELPTGWLDSQPPPNEKTKPKAPILPENGGLAPFYGATPAGVLPHDPDVITRKDITIMGLDALPAEFRFEAEHDLPGEAGELTIPKGHYAVLDSTVAHRPRDVVLVAFADGAIGLRRIAQGEDGRAYLLGAGAVAPLTDQHRLLAVAVGASTPRLKRPKKR